MRAKILRHVVCAPLGEYSVAVAVLGELETEIMRVLWATHEPLTVRAVFEELSTQRQLAYTTVMTVLDRLAKKGKVERRQLGRAWLYRPAMTHSSMVTQEMSSLLHDAGDEANLVLGEFVQQLAAPQRAHLARVLRASGDL